MTLFIVGFGSGSRGCMTADAFNAISSCKNVVGYKTYVDLVRPLFPDKEYFSTGMRGETERVRIALESARRCDTALICSGDAELYGMAALAFELSRDECELTVVPGVTAAFSAGALLGAPLTTDTAIISLSDLLTPRERIEKRLRCAAEGDFVTVLYNPSSRTRTDCLAMACDIMLSFRSPETVCGYARNIGRKGQESMLLTLSQLRDAKVDMFTTVIIGCSDTKLIRGRMVTPRGYRDV